MNGADQPTYWPPSSLSFLLEKERPCLLAEGLMIYKISRGVFRGLPFSPTLPQGPGLIPSVPSLSTQGLKSAGRCRGPEAATVPVRGYS